MLSKTMDEIPLGHFTDGRIGGIEYPVANPDDPTQCFDRARLARSSAYDDPARSVAIRSHRRRQIAAEQSPHPSERRISARQALRIRLRRRRSGRRGRRLSRCFAISRRTRNTIRNRSRPHSASTAKEFRRMVVSFAIFSTRASTPTRKAASLSTECSLTSPAPAAAASTIASRSLHAMHNRLHRSSSRPTSSLSPISPKPIRSPAKPAGYSTSRPNKTSCRKFSFQTRRTNIGAASCALIHVTPDGLHDATISPNIRIYHFTGLAAFQRLLPAGKRQRRPRRPATRIAASGALFLARDDRQHGRLGAQQHRAARQQLSKNCRRHADSYSKNTIRPRSPACTDRTRQPPHTASISARTGATEFSACSRQKSARRFPVLVPAIDADGNERDGIRLPEITVPLASYLSWNLRDPSIGAPKRTRRIRIVVRAVSENRSRAPPIARSAQIDRRSL